MARKEKTGLRHTGQEAFMEERKKLLDSFDRAKRAASNDAVKVDHGVVAEAELRAWLSSFLPKKYGVTKGYVISPDPGYQEDMHEWDIIVFDQLEAPILFVRDSADNSEYGRKRAIPIEHVRGIVEAKAALTPESAADAADKLLRLQSLLKADLPNRRLRQFVATTVFFETNCESEHTYRRALDHLARIDQGDVPYFGSLVLRSQSSPEFSGHLECITLPSENALEGIPELSRPYKRSDGSWGVFGAFMYGENYFSSFLFSYLRALNGQDTRITSLYGLNFESPGGSRLFS